MYTDLWTFKFIENLLVFYFIFSFFPFCMVNDTNEWANVFWMKCVVTRVYRVAAIYVVNGVRGERRTHAEIFKKKS